MEKRLKLEPTPPPPPKDDNYQAKDKHTNFISDNSRGESVSVRATSEDPHSCAFICTPSSPFGRTRVAARLFEPLCPHLAGPA